MTTRPRAAARLAAVLAAVAAAAAAATLLTARAQPGHPHRRPANGPFAWLTARAAPANWPRITLPDGAATLAAPPSLPRMHGDPGSITVGLPAGTGAQIYLNATPHQGEETLPGWAAFRVDHLRDDDATTVTADAHAEHLTFLGGTGSCLLDDYLSRVAAHHYREIACLVQGAHGASVLIAATSAADWSRYTPTLEQAVTGYTAH